MYDAYLEWRNVMKETQRMELVTILANYYLQRFGLDDWKFRVNKRLKKSYGQCCWETKTIELSLSHIEQDSMCSLILTLIHELSHALVGPDVESHGRVWDSKYQELKLLY